MLLWSPLPSLVPLAWVMTTILGCLPSAEGMAAMRLAISCTSVASHPSDLAKAPASFSFPKRMSTYGSSLVMAGTSTCSARYS